MEAIILSIGGELTEGFYADTNSQFLSEQLTLMGINVIKTIIIPDNLDAIIENVQTILNEADIIISTGGIGPTDDDMTREGFSKALNLPLELNEEELERIKDIFKRYRYQYSPDNDKQALFPKTSEIILNKAGTASGFYINNNGTKIFVLPGVPSQAKHLFKKFIKPKIQEELKTKTAYFIAKNLNIGEGSLNEKFRKNIEHENIEWGTISKEDGIHLKVRAMGDDADNIIKKIKTKVTEVFKKNIWGWDDDELASLLADILIQKNYTISTAESCSSGLISKILTDFPGSSKYYKGSIIAYSNEVKEKNLKVDKKIIKKHGAVSEEVVIQMAENVKSIIKTDCSIAVSGIAGPDGGTKDKPVGTVCFAVCTPEKKKTYKIMLPGNRNEVRLRTAYISLALLLKELKK